MDEKPVCPHHSYQLEDTWGGPGGRGHRLLARVPGGILKTLDERSSGASTMANYQGLILADSLSKANGTYLSDSHSRDTGLRRLDPVRPESGRDTSTEWTSSK